MAEQQDPVPTLRESQAVVLTPIPGLSSVTRQAYYHQCVPVVVGDFYESERRRTSGAHNLRQP